MLIFLQRHASFAFLMAFVIGWSSVAFAVQKPIHQQMMNNATAMQMNPAVAQQPTHVASEHPAQSATDEGMAHHSVKMMQMADCHQSSVQTTDHMGKVAPDCPSDSPKMNNMAQCSDCALWHCQSVASSLDVHSAHFELPILSVFSEQPNAIYNAKYLQGHKLELLRPPKA